MPVIEKLDARLDGIGHLLADRYIVVPPYQRAYSWTDEQITELLRDFSDAMRNKGTDEYFLGTVVLTKNKDGPHSVIDGQQRLATVSILICAIRNHFYAAADKERADAPHQEYLAKKELRGLTENPHLRLIASDNGFYEEHILAKPAVEEAQAGPAKRTSPASHTRLAKALQLAKDHVAALVKQTHDPAQLLLDWIEYLHDNAKVIVVEVNNEAAAYTIFEVLNDRGLELSVSDLLKNFIFSSAEDKVAEAQLHWTSMVSVLEASGAEEKDLKTFMRHVWSSRHGLTREKELYDKIRAQVTSKQRAVDFAKDLGEQARVYAALDNPSDDYWKAYGASTRESIEALQLLKAVQIRPLLIAILKHFDEKEVRQTLPMLVCWTVRFLIVGKLGSGPLENGYAERAKEVSAGTIKTAKQLLHASDKLLATDDEFEQAFRGARVSAQYLARFYLRVLEKQQAGGDGKELIVNPSEEAVTLEHIMPQTRDPHWTGISADTHRSNLKRLGNLALLDKELNEEGGNLPFAAKAKALVKSKITLTREVGDLAAWDIKAIDDRQARLAQIAVMAWPLKPR